MHKPQPRITELNRPFWAGCNEGRLMIQRCRACARAIFYPRVCCPFCKAGDLEWFAASGLGKIISHTTVHRTHHDGFNAEAPYVFAAVELSEGPWMYAQVAGAATDGTSLVGQSVSSEFVKHNPNQRIVAFRLRQNPAIG